MAGLAKARIFASALFLAGLASGAVHAAQCGNDSGGFEAWKAEFSQEAASRGIGSKALNALAGTSYAKKTISADRNQKSFKLSLDEFMARFDAAIFAQGRLLGEIPERWADYRGALQPMFMVEPPSPAHWISSYLPVNAAFLALGGLVGLETLVNPAWAAFTGR